MTSTRGLEGDVTVSINGNDYACLYAIGDAGRLVVRPEWVQQLRPTARMATPEEVSLVVAALDAAFDVTVQADQTTRVTVREAFERRRDGRTKVSAAVIAQLLRENTATEATAICAAVFDALGDTAVHVNPVTTAHIKRIYEIRLNRPRSAAAIIGAADLLRALRAYEESEIAFVHAERPDGTACCVFVDPEVTRAVGCFVGKDRRRPPNLM